HCIGPNERRRVCAREAVMLLIVAALAASQVAQGPGFPPVVTAGTQNLEFHVSNPRARNSLEAQVSTAFADALEKNRGATIVKLRAFAHPEDLALVRTLLAQRLVDAHVSLPVLSLVGVAGFIESDQRIVIESTASREQSLNPNGVVFVAGLAAPTPERTTNG